MLIRQSDLSKVREVPKLGLLIVYVGLCCCLRAALCVQTHGGAIGLCADGVPAGERGKSEPFSRSYLRYRPVFFVSD